MNVTIVDYGMGNLGSVRRALAEIGADLIIADRPEQLAGADRIILPGVGSFTDGMTRLNTFGWSDEIRRQVQSEGKPLLGICLGMQLLAGSGSEGGNTAGLGLIPGANVHLETLGCKLRVPHVGWNSVVPCAEQSLFVGLPAGTDFYFVHSYTFLPDDPKHVLATTDYDVPFVAAVASGNTFGTQFHPEKSSKAGFRLLKNFVEFSPC